MNVAGCSRAVEGFFPQFVRAGQVFVWRSSSGFVLLSCHRSDRLLGLPSPISICLCNLRAAEPAAVLSAGGLGRAGRGSQRGHGR